MPRRARVRLSGQPWHVIQRGVNRVPCFVGDGDRHHYLSLLAEQSSRHRCHVHAYVLMPNHVHLLVTPADAHGVSRMMKDLGQRYVQSFNRAHKRTGTLWEGRFRSSVIDSQRYLFTCQRYIELNPVRASLASHPRDFAWSSYLANAEGVPGSIVTPHPLYLALSNDIEERRASYRALFAAELAPDEIHAIREAAHGGCALGGPAHVWPLHSAVGMAPVRSRHHLPRSARQLR